MRNLSGNYYVDQDQFLLENDLIFACSWQLIGSVSQVTEPGQYLSEVFCGQKYFVIRSRDGVLRGFRNACRHRGAPLLARGSGKCQGIRCPYHNWLYDDFGNLRQAPWFDEKGEFDLTQWPIEPIEVSIFRGLIFVCLHPSQSLVDQLGALGEELDDVPIQTYHWVHTERRVFSANWKVYTDNFVEGYHIPGIHPGFFDAIEFDEFSTTAENGYVKMTAPAKETLFYQGRWYWMWPNWTLSLFDGGMNTSRINPISSDQTELVYQFYFSDVGASNQSNRDQTITDNLKIVEQDFAICQGTHENYAANAYQSGPLSPKHEQGVKYFQDRYREALNFKPL